jgi:hypothetical protein
MVDPNDSNYLGLINRMRPDQEELTRLSHLDPFFMNHFSNCSVHLSSCKKEQDFSCIAPSFRTPFYETARRDRLTSGTPYSCNAG